MTVGLAKINYGDLENYSLNYIEDAGTGSQKFEEWIEDEDMQ